MVSLYPYVMRCQAEKVFSWGEHWAILINPVQMKNAAICQTWISLRNLKNWETPKKDTLKDSADLHFYFGQVLQMGFCDELCSKDISASQESLF